MTRRTIQYQGIQDVIDDIRRLQAGPYQRCGQWSLTQICEHLHLAMDSSLTPTPDMPFAWFVRHTVGPLLLKQILRSGRMRSGLAAPGAFQPQPATEDDNERIDRFVATLQKVASATAFEPSIFFGAMTPEVWRSFHLIHCAHHLSHLVPAPA